MTIGRYVYLRRWAIRLGHDETLPYVTAFRTPGGHFFCLVAVRLGPLVLRVCRGRYWVRRVEWRGRNWDPAAPNPGRRFEA